MDNTERKLKIYDRILATVSALGVIAGGLWTLNGIIEAQNKETKLHRQQINISIFNEKKSLYNELIDSESEVAACNTKQEVIEAQKHFRKLFVGRAHIIGKLDKDVNAQKISFDDLLDKYIKEKSPVRPFDYFGPASLDLVEVCKIHLTQELLVE